MTYSGTRLATASALDVAAEELALAVAAMQFTADAASPLRLLREPSPMDRLPVLRRARSVSPQRRSPKLRHTNGRLDVDPFEVEVPARVQMRRSRAGVWAIERTCALLSEDELLRVMQLETQAHRSTTADAASRTRATRQRCERHSFPTRKDVRRSSSCLEAGETAGSNGDHQQTQTPHRFRIYYRDEALRESCAKNTRRMIENARRVRGASIESSPSANETAAETAATQSPLAQEPSQHEQGSVATNQQQIAWRALRYRKLLARADAIDDARLHDPSFDVLECLGAQWCKV